MKKRELRIAFADFWNNFNCTSNFFTQALSLRFDIIIDEKDPEVLIYSCFGYRFLKYKKAIRIFYTGENRRPNFLACDFSISFDYNDYKNRNLRLPLYVLYNNASDFLKPKLVNEIVQQKKKFCNMLVSNSRAKERIRFFKILNRLQQVDSGGSVLNNIGYKVGNKMEFMQQYRFTIAFENSSYPGYTTEKIVEAMSINTIPIYWGNKDIGREFNSKSFINVHDYNSFEETAAAVFKIASDETAYRQMLAEPWFVDGKPNEYFNPERVPDFFEQVVLKRKPFTKIEIFSRNIKAYARVIYRSLYT